ncbi:MAG: tRNA epoxyqueuosine(34) reductase QueG, partial [Muribaculaceae bacterium]|nr:tRNA epoxyqueuosine(34) reductase QueG [Muribaculaceae bacterium]
MSLFDTLRQEASLAGFSAFGVARVEPVDRRWAESYARWLGDGCHASMGYLESHRELRSDPAGLLPG